MDTAQMKELDKFITDQMSVWPLASSNFRSIKNAETRTVTVGGLEAMIQHNSCRIISSTARTDESSIAARPCFLCPDNRPKEQFHIKFSGRKGRTYNIQLNPYPVTRKHLVIARDMHLPQVIWHHFPDMLTFTVMYPGFTVFYNGPASGASAPDHLHFQAVPRMILPLERAADSFLDNPGEPIASVQDATLYHFRLFTRGVYALRATTSKSMAKLFYRLLECSPRREGENEPRFNLYTWYRDGEYRTVVVLRSQARSHHYYSSGEDHLTMSPGAADMAGLFISALREDFDKVDGALLSEMVSEVSISEKEEEMVDWRLTRQQRIVEVGIMTGKEIVFEIISDGAGPQKVSWKAGRIDYNGTLYDELTFDAVTRSTLFAEPSFILYDVTIGIGFHWERKVSRKYAGRLKFIVEGDSVRAVNCIGMEDYLLSVVSSEMNPDSPAEFLKAHAIISRSWLLRNMRRNHDNFDVCADDHCQRYQGFAENIGKNICDAIDQTWGMVLTYDGEVCDARYSKCCGGMTELYSTCWGDGEELPYLQAVEDAPSPGGKPWCDTSDQVLLSRILKSYDQETTGFFRWEERYTREGLSSLFERKTGLHIGTILSLEPLQRGPSGRISALKVNGTEGSVDIGKELNIRKALSESCLKSSAFEVKWNGDECILEGRGWGHGAGLCQIGAAVMAANGRSCEEILSHYYPGTGIKSV